MATETQKDHLNNANDNDNSDFLAKPSSSCCLYGSLHQGHPRGIFAPVAGVDTYVSLPDPAKANGNIVLYFPDVWGMFTNGLLVMDAFADAGYLVLGVDYFRGVSKHSNNAEATTAVNLAKLFVRSGPRLETPQGPPRQIQSRL